MINYGAAFLNNPFDLGKCLYNFFVGEPGKQGDTYDTIKGVIRKRQIGHISYFYINVLYPSFIEAGFTPFNHKRRVIDGGDSSHFI